MFKFFKKKEKKENIELSKLKVDVHSHLIPGIDDGAKTTEESLEMLSKMSELGYKKVITTPHIMMDFYPNTEEDILNRFEKLKFEVKEAKIDIDLEVAAEYYFDEFFHEKVNNKKVLTFSGNHLLFECSFFHKPINIEQLVFEINSKAYQPVIAHFERYSYFEIKDAERLKELGCKIQMNLNSLSSHYGDKVKKQAESLIDNKLIDIVGTDCHKIEHLQLLEKNLSRTYFHKMLDLDLMNYQL